MEIPIVLKTEEWADSKRVAPYFLDEVWREAEKILTAKGRSPAEGGWTIRTTLNPHHQKTAEEMIDKWMPESGFKSDLCPLNREPVRLLHLSVGLIIMKVHLTGQLKRNANLVLQ